MFRLLQVAALLGMSLMLTNASDAKGSRGGSGRGSSARVGQSHSLANSGHRNTGTGKNNSGRGMGNNHRPNHTHSRGYNGWGNRYWNSGYGCEFCWSGVYGCYFYYYAPAYCFYPVSYIAQFPPTCASVAVAPAASTGPVGPAPAGPMPYVQVINSNQNTLANGAPVPGSSGPLALPPAH